MTGKTRSEWPAGTYRLVRDTWRVFADGAAWLCRSLWRANKVVARGVLPGQSRAVQKIVAALAVLLELVALVVALSDWAARS